MGLYLKIPITQIKSISKSNGGNKFKKVVLKYKSKDNSLASVYRAINLSQIHIFFTGFENAKMKQWEKTTKTQSLKTK